MEKEVEEIKKTLDYFFNGFNNIDENMIKNAFHRNAVLYAFNQQKELVRIELDEWLKMFPKIKENPNHPYNLEKCEKKIKYIDVEGTAAQAKVEWIFKKFKFSDYYNLIKEDGRWYIVNKIWYTTLF